MQHLLCQGFRKLIGNSTVNRDANPLCSIPGVASVFPNGHATMLKASPWPQILNLLGTEGEKIMIDLLLGCGIFRELESGLGNYYQLSGMYSYHQLG